jgi:hypothetical protein
MSDLSRRANQVLDEARASRPALDRRRKERVRQAVAATVATTAVAAGAQAAKAVGATKSVATAWVTTTVGKVVLGVGAAVVGSGLTVGVMSARRAAVAVVRPAVEPGVGSRRGTFSTAHEAQPMNAASAKPDAVRPQAESVGPAEEERAAPVRRTSEDGPVGQLGTATGQELEDERPAQVNAEPTRPPEEGPVAKVNGATAGTPSDERAANAGTVTGQVPQAGRAAPSRLAAAGGLATDPSTTTAGRTAAAEVHLEPPHATAPGVEARSGRTADAPDDARRSDKPAPVAARDGARIVGGPASGGAGLGANAGSPNGPLQTPPDRTTPEVAVAAPPLVPTADARDSSRGLPVSPRPERAPSASAPRPSSRPSEARGSETAFGSTGGSGRPPPEPAAPLRDELSVLRLAKAQHDAGDFAAALASLDAYDTRFPDGVMAVESQVLRVLTLCELGRKPDARAVLTALQRKTPKSPAVTRLKTSCAAE